MSKQQSKYTSFSDLASLTPTYRPMPETPVLIAETPGDSFDSSANVGWLYYKDYFRDLNLKPHPETESEREAIKAKENGEKLKPKTEALLKQPLPSSGSIHSRVHGFNLMTTYPGLLSGIGMKHETKQAEGELKLGFAFDHTTGLPYIPGSGVKGKLRAFFPNLLRRHAAEQRESEVKDYLLHRANQLEAYMIEVLNEQFPQIAQQHTFTAANVALMERNIFDGTDEAGKQLNPYRKDIFYDAVAIESGNDDRRFLFTDSITPHPHPLKNPNPIQFLKVGPKVTFQFSFRLGAIRINGLDFSAKNKETLFKYLLLQHGVGAKTRVGYGQFVVAG